jgi:hypothetical protein
MASGRGSLPGSFTVDRRFGDGYYWCLKEKAIGNCPRGLKPRKIEDRAEEKPRRLLWSEFQELSWLFFASTQVS